MAEIPEQDPPQCPDPETPPNSEAKPEKDPLPPPPATPNSSFFAPSFGIWPPSDRTRDAVLRRLVEILSSPSFLSQRYGSLPSDEASFIARQIEEEAFATAAASQPPDADRIPDSDGMETLQIYSRAISKTMLEIVKARAVSVSSLTTALSGSSVRGPPDNGKASSIPASDAAGGEEIASSEVGALPA